MASLLALGLNGISSKDPWATSIGDLASWTCVLHQAINGLDEGVPHRTFGDLGAEG